ncbi:MAG: 16S rRNA (cytidine(1402)-2'-O)-methyltransferase [Abditibacteriota bacterium]|nr:16S rRNA (cytidine(1402)-2'-O)-methyltransferase [Abditibacteriota bacterium]
MSGTLYITATPIGNMEDITLRALRILREADLIACEDTRTTMKLLARYDIHTPLVSHHKFSADKEVLAIIELLEAGRTCALVTDAGTPCVSDPGSRLIALACEKGIAVEALPGACAFITALTLSGFDAQSFRFAGFPPRKSGELRAFFARIAPETCATGIYEAPGRVKKTLAVIAEVMPGRRLSFSRELTKLHEETVRGTAAEILEAYEGREVKGEAVIIIDGCREPEESREEPVDAAELLRSLLDEGMSPRDAVRVCSRRTGIPRNTLYRELLKQPGE